MPRLLCISTNFSRRLVGLPKSLKFVRRKSAASIDTDVNNNNATESSKIKHEPIRSLYLFAPAEYFANKKVFKPTSVLIDEVLPKDGQCGLPVLPTGLRQNIEREIESTNLDGWAERKVELTKLPQLYLQLSKARLSTLVVITALGGYALCPFPMSYVALASCGIGTCLMSFCANSLNQFLEAPFDSQMKRTQARVLVRRLLSPTHALGFAAASGCIGFAALWIGANPLTAALGLTNVILYSAIYTPMKRFSIYNTWVGSVVGAIPPLMGWSACCGSLDASALVLGGILFAWQFPHFNSLSWNLRADYSKAGYRMMSVTRPDLLARTTLTYTLSLLGLSSVAVPLCGITTWTFAVTSLPLNLYFLYHAVRFYKETDSKNAKKLFRSSLAYLPILMTLMWLSKASIES